MPQDEGTAAVSDPTQKPPLRVKVIGATGLRKADFPPFTSDPFCLIEMSGQTWRTPVLKNTLNPVWNFEFETRDYRLGDRLMFRVYDRLVGVAEDSDRIGDEDALGHCSLSCAEWAYPGGLRCEVRLTDNGRKTYAARLQIQDQQRATRVSRRAPILGGLTADVAKIGVDAKGMEALRAKSQWATRIGDAIEVVGHFGIRRARGAAVPYRFAAESDMGSLTAALTMLGGDSGAAEGSRTADAAVPTNAPIPEQQQAPPQLRSTSRPNLSLHFLGGDHCLADQLWPTAYILLRILSGDTFLTDQLRQIAYISLHFWGGDTFFTDQLRPIAYPSLRSLGGDNIYTEGLLLLVYIPLRFLGGDTFYTDQLRPIAYPSLRFLGGDNIYTEGLLLLVYIPLRFLGGDTFCTDQLRPIEYISLHFWGGDAFLTGQLRSIAYFSLYILGVGIFINMFGPSMADLQAVGTGAKGAKTRKADDGAGALVPSGASSSAAPPGGGKQREQLLAEIVALEGRIALRNSRDIADLTAITHRVWLLPSDSEPITMATQVSRWYGDRVRGTPGHGLGMPDYHIWKSLVTWVAETGRAEAHRTLMATYLSSLKTIDDYKGRVHVCLVSGTAREGTKRLKISVAPVINDALEVLAAELSNVDGVEEKHGRAPCSGIERELSTKLDTLAHKLKSTGPGT